MSDNLCSILVATEDREYLERIADNAVAGLQMCIAAHREGAHLFLEHCTTQWLNAMEKETHRWDMFEGRMAAVQSFPIGVNEKDPRVIAFGQRLAAYWERKINS